MVTNIIKSLVLPLALAGAQANAASISFFIDQSNDLSDGIDYAQVTISDGLAGDIDFSVAVIASAFSVSPGANFGIQTFSFNYDTAAMLSIGSANVTDINPSTWNVSQNANAGGGFGKFEFEIAGTGSTRTELLTFAISGVIGDSIFDYALESTLNPSSGEFFATHIAGFDLTDGVTSAQFAGSSPVPVPAAVWLLGSGLLGLAGVVRRRNGHSNS